MWQKLGTPRSGCPNRWGHRAAQVLLASGSAYSPFVAGSASASRRWLTSAVSAAYSSSRLTGRTGGHRWMCARTATPATNAARWRHSPARRESAPLFLNVAQGSVNRKAECRFDTLSGGLRWTLADQSTIGTIRSELENDPRGLWWTVIPMPGSQEVRGSIPLRSTNCPLLNNADSHNADWHYAGLRTAQRCTATQAVSLTLARQLRAMATAV